MRIITGLYRGRKLKTLPGRDLRPTSGKLRETLFDILQSSVEGCVFVDCYAGSGAVGLEAASRGARQVFLIEENDPAVSVIRANLAALGIRDNPEIQILCAPVHKALRLLEHRGVQADICFLDPPYAAQREYARSLRRLMASDLMSPNGLIILQHSRGETIEHPEGRWERTRLLNQGSSALSFYRKTQETEAGSQESE